MSFKLVVKAFEARVGNSARKIVLIKLADQANDQGVCWPSYETLAHACEVDRRTVIRHVKRLEADGFLRVERIYNSETKKNHSNRYHLTIDKGMKESDSSSDNLSLGVVSESHHPSVTESLGVVSESHHPSVTESPEPITEPINLEPIIESKEKGALENSTSDKSKSKKFVKPTIAELTEYFTDRKHPAPKAEAEAFYDFYESNGWRVSKNPMKDWKATVRNWIRRDNNKPQPRFNIDNEDWGKTSSHASDTNYDIPAGYHPSHNPAPEPTQAAPATDIWFDKPPHMGGKTYPLLAGKTYAQTMGLVAEQLQPGESREACYMRLAEDMGVA